MPRSPRGRSRSAALLSISSQVFIQQQVGRLPSLNPLRTMIFTRAFAVTAIFLSSLVNAATYTGTVQVINGEGSSNGFLKNWSSGL